MTEENILRDADHTRQAYEAAAKRGEILMDRLDFEGLIYAVPDEHRYRIKAHILRALIEEHCEGQKSQIIEDAIRQGVK